MQRRISQGNRTVCLASAGPPKQARSSADRIQNIPTSFAREIPFKLRISRLVNNARFLVLDPCNARVQVRRENVSSNREHEAEEDHHSPTQEQVFPRQKDEHDNHHSPSVCQHVTDARPYVMRDVYPGQASVEKKYATKNDHRVDDDRSSRKTSASRDHNRNHNRNRNASHASEKKENNDEDDDE